MMRNSIAALLVQFRIMKDNEKKETETEILDESDVSAASANLIG